MTLKVKARGQKVAWKKGGGVGDVAVPPRLARREVEATKSPCVYLGLKVGQNFEPDPAKWQLDAWAGWRKSQAPVWYEYPGVRRGDDGGKPHRVCVNATNVVHHGRNVPGNPLRASAPLGLTFTVDFMQAVAGNVAPRAEFKGVTYDSDRPEIQLEVPRGGRDIQGDSVYWVLPGGRCVCKSLRECACLSPADLAKASTLEAYAAAAD